MTARRYLGPHPPRYVYRPSRPYTDEDLRRMRAAVAEINAAPWHVVAPDPPEDEDEPEGAEYTAPEPERPRKRKRPAKVAATPTGPRVTPWPPPGVETWRDHFERTGDAGPVPVAIRRED